MESCIISPRSLPRPVPRNTSLSSLGWRIVSDSWTSSPGQPPKALKGDDRWANWGQMWVDLLISGRGTGTMLAHEQLLRQSVALTAAPPSQPTSQSPADAPTVGLDYSME